MLPHAPVPSLKMSCRTLLCITLPASMQSLPTDVEPEMKTWAGMLVLLTPVTECEEGSAWIWGPNWEPVRSFILAAVYWQVCIGALRFHYRCCFHLGTNLGALLILITDDVVVVSVNHEKLNGSVSQKPVMSSSVNHPVFMLRTAPAHMAIVSFQRSLRGVVCEWMCLLALCGWCQG